MGLVVETVSQQVVFSQSYDAANDLYSETFSIGLAEVPQNVYLRIRSFLNQAHYFRSQTALDTPVTLALVSLPGQPYQRFAAHFDQGAEILYAPETPLLSSYTGFPETLLVSPHARNRGFPFRIGYRLADAAYYPEWSAYGFINNLEEFHEGLMIQGTTYAASLDLPFYSRGGYLALIPYLASLKQTEVYASTRVRFVIEVDVEAYNHQLPDFLNAGAY